MASPAKGKAFNFDYGFIITDREANVNEILRYY